MVSRLMKTRFYTDILYGICKINDLINIRVNLVSNYINTFLFAQPTSESQSLERGRLAPRNTIVLSLRHGYDSHV